MPEKITGIVTITQKSFERIVERTKNISDFSGEIKRNLNKEITQILEVILAGALNLDSSDIHIEPEEKKIKIRVRIDGVLHDVLYIELKTYRGLLSRIKLLSGIKLNITDRAQDGRFTILARGTPIEVRTSTLPSEHGETIVMRILNPKSLIEIEDLGVREDVLQAFKKEIAQPNGMVIVTGPTGSGKTTTLYAILKRIQHPEIKIITIEDPIEYHLEGISQTQVNPKKGYDFATGLRAIVRQDPDIILVGEVRDFETAKIALQAALTGHLVLSTLHTNDAAGTVARLQALGEKPINIAPAISLAIGQRLVRKVCKKCVKLEKPAEKELTKIKEELKSLAKEVKIPYLNNLKIPEAKGCKSCNFTGYRGRIGIFEFFLIDDEMENFILKSPSISDLRKMAQKKGMVTMRKDGLIKVLKGITTIEEVNRVTGE
ncbi:type II/IV secretion system protein [Patescibacteria group bacterium]|nr:type II/IV secretion system protein [Patescibacteria group bacterium]